MLDPLAAKLADLLVNYSLKIKKNQTVLIEGSSEAAPLINEIYRYTLRAGGHPFTYVRLPGQSYIFHKEAADFQLEYGNPVSEHIVGVIDRVVRIYSDTNTRELLHTPPEKTQKTTLANARFNEIFQHRFASGEIDYAILAWPTTALAMEAGMSNEEFADMIACSCFLDQPDPLAAWQALDAEQQRLCAIFSRFEQLHILGDGTDLKLSIKGRQWVNASGQNSLPDGEIFSAPLEDSVNGVVHFSSGSRAVKGICMTFKNGEVVAYSAEQGQDHLAKTLETPTARRLGEIGIGTNFGLKEIVNQILFDEKIGGTIHLALGYSIHGTGGQNGGPLHWDLLVDLRKEGRIYADGSLVFENGKILV